MMRRVEAQNGSFCVGEDICSSQTTKEGSESTLLVATVWSTFVLYRPSAEILSSVKGREVQHSRGHFA